MALSFIGELGQLNIDAETATVLPTLTQSMIGLIGISHGGYLIAKLPDRAAEPGSETTTGAEVDNVEEVVET